MKRFAMAVALTVVISVTTLAGNIPIGDFVPPPPPPSNTLLANVVLTIITLIGR